MRLPCPQTSNGRSNTRSYARNQIQNSSFYLSHFHVPNIIILDLDTKSRKSLSSVRQQTKPSMTTADNASMKRMISFSLTTLIAASTVAYIIAHDHNLADIHQHVKVSLHFAFTCKLDFELLCILIAIPLLFFACPLKLCRKIR
jgi:hypothetical protein